MSSILGYFATDEIKTALAGYIIYRCADYTQIIEAVQAAAGEKAYG